MSAIDAEALAYFREQKAKAAAPVPVHDPLAVEIPPQLRNDGWRFILLPPGKKGGGNERDWQSTANYSWDDPKLQRHLAAGGNYGTFPAPGSGNAILDADDYEACRDARLLDGLEEQTFTVETGGSRDEQRKYHFYFHADPPLEGKHPLNLEDGRHAGEVYAEHPDGAKGYCVGPGSVHPSGERYRVECDKPIRTVNGETFAARLSQLKGRSRTPGEARTDPAPTSRPTGNGETLSDRLGLKVTDFLMPEKARRRGNEWEGEHPVHGSSTGTNLTVTEDTWYCRRCGTGGGPLEALAVAAGIIDCAEVRPGCLSDRKVWKKVMDELRKRGYPVDETAPKRSEVPAPATPEAAAREEDLARACADFNTTDTGNGDRFAARYRGEALYCRPRKTWYLWDGARWRPDRGGAVLELAKVAAVAINREAALAPDDTNRGELRRWAKDSESQFRLKAMLESASSIGGIAVLPDAFDADPDLFNCLNGTLNLRTLELQPHAPGDLITKVAGAEHDPTATCPRWEAHLALIFDGDRELIDSTQELLGYAMQAGNGEQIFPIWWGDGQNGKSVTIAVVRSIFGDYAVSVAPETFMDTGRDGGPKPELLKMRGARFVSAVEGRKGQRLNEPLIKQMTGGDPITCRGLFQDMETFDPSHLAILVTNPKPVIEGDDWAIWRRVLMWPFTVTIPAERKIPDYERVLLEEASGILNWMLEGLQRYRERGRLEIPEKVRAATEQYRTESDIIGPFLREQCVRAPGEMVVRSALYDRYHVWCQDRDEEPITKRAFATTLRGRTGIVDGGQASGGRRRWSGLRLKTPAEIAADEAAGSTQERL